MGRTKKEFLYQTMIFEEHLRQMAHFIKITFHFSNVFDHVTSYDKGTVGYCTKIFVTLIVVNRHPNLKFSRTLLLYQPCTYPTSMRVPFKNVCEK